MNGVLERTLGVLELLSRHGDGLELAVIADQLDIPRSAEIGRASCRERV